MKTGISIVLLAYKEEENLRVLLPKIRYYVDKIVDGVTEEYEILVIDTEKPLDNTAEVCKEFGCRYINQEKPNFGGAFQTGIKYAEMDKFLIMDADGSHDPKYIPDIYKMFTEQNCDITIGSRYVKGGHTDDAKSSILMSHILNTAFRVCLGISAKDISTDFRMYHTYDLKNVKLINKNYDILQEVLLKIQMNHKEKLVIGEVPITFAKRMYGESKRRLMEFIIDYMKSLLRLTAMRFPVLRNFVLYGIFGCTAAFLEYLIFVVLVRFEILHKPEIANIIGSVCGFMFTFLMNTYTNFRKSDKLHRRFISYAAICASGIAFTTIVISLLKNLINVFYLKAVLLVFVSLVQFILNRKITYKE